MRCTNCGCKKLIKTGTPFGSWGQDVTSYADKTLAIYSCFDCGHLEFFSTDAVDEYKKNISRKSSILIELENLRKELNELEDIEKAFEVKQIEERLKSLDITIREQNELTEKLKVLKSQIKETPNKIVSSHRMLNQKSNIKRKIKELEEELKRVEENIAKVDIIEV